MTEKIRWGILAPGRIARKFATGLTYLADAEIAAVGARSRESVAAFAVEFDVARHHVGYQKLATDPDVDVVYVASPHTFHMEHALLCIDHGKAVLCEKPFTINAAQAKRVIDRARERGVFVMEAMWPRHLPLMAKVRELVADHVIGDIRMITGDFGFRTNFNPESRLFDPKLGGGSLLDVGVYPVSFASMLLGTPDRISSMAELGATGVDEQAAIILGYTGGAMAVILTAIRTRTPSETTIMGTDGMIRIHPPSWVATKLTIHREGQEPEDMAIPFAGNGYNYQAAETHACLRAGKLESDVIPLDETLSILETMDKIRSQWGLQYPMELDITDW